MTNSREFLDKIVDVIIDKPLGSKHSEKYPNHIYPVNYGYVPNTISGDNEELDCYILGIFEPLETFKGKCIAIIHRTNDNDDKLIVVPEGRNYSNEEKKTFLEIVKNGASFFFKYARLGELKIN